MITKMKKLTFLAYHKEYEDFLNSLRELGVVHIVEKQQGIAENAELQDSIRLSSRLAAAIKLLQNVKLDKDTAVAKEGGTPQRGAQVLDEIDALQTEKSKLTQQLQGYAKERDALTAWGDFEPENVRRLNEAGYTVGFYTCSEGNYKEERETEYNAMVISRYVFKSILYNRNERRSRSRSGCRAGQVPAYSLTRVNQLYAETEQAITENEGKLALLAEKDIPSLKEMERDLQNNIEFSKVVLSTEQAAGEKLMLLEGWVPARNKIEIEAFLDSSHVYYELSDPTPEDNVPIELNNKGFFSWFEPICKLYMLPKYNELDLTPFFAPVLYGFLRALSRRFGVWIISFCGCYGISSDG